MKLRKMLALSQAVGRNKDSEVEAICNEALAINDRDFFALATLAETYWQNRRQSDAFPLVLRAIEIEPSHFDSLRIAASISVDRGEFDKAYFYAKRLICVGSPQLPPMKIMSRLLALFRWLPKARRLSLRMSEHAQESRESDSDWIKWAHEFVSHYEDGEAFAQ